MALTPSRTKTYVQGFKAGKLKHKFPEQANLFEFRRIDVKFGANLEQGAFDRPYWTPIAHTAGFSSGHH